MFHIEIIVLSVDWHALPHRFQMYSTFHCYILCTPIKKATVAVCTVQCELY